MLPADREEIRAVARRYFGAGLCCAVETQRRGRWESRVLALHSASPGAVLAAVEETLAGRPGERVRLAAYSGSSLTRLDLPAPIVCSRPAPARLFGEGDQALEVALDRRSGA
jgi:ribulose bisphosphate carboxylase small subunit